MKGYVKRDDDGRIIVDSNGFITIACEDDSVIFQLHLSEIDEKVEQMCFNVNGKDIYIDIYPGWEINENDPITEDDVKTVLPSTSKGRNVVFPWCDASTKLFLKEYKVKKELVKNRKLKNMKLAYQEISKDLQDNGYNVSPLQVENRFKTLKRAYKNMIISNRRTGRGRYICSYEQELDEIFAPRHITLGLEINGEVNSETAGSECMRDNKDNQLKNIFMKTSTFNVEAVHNNKNNLINENNSKLEAQNMKIVDSLQTCQHALKTLITKMDSKNKSFNDVQQKLLQVHTEMRDMQKEAFAQAEQQRQKANEQRERRNSLLEEIINLLKSRKDA